VVTVRFALLLILIAAIAAVAGAESSISGNTIMRTQAIALGLAVAGILLLRLPDGTTAVLHTAREYFSFISLIGSLFVVAGGIHLKVKGERRRSTTWSFSRSAR